MASCGLREETELTTTTARATAVRPTFASTALRQGAMSRQRAAGEPVKIDANVVAGEQCLNITASHDGRLIAWPDDRTLIHVWDWKNSQPLRLDSPRMLQGWHGLAFFPDAAAVRCLG